MYEAAIARWEKHERTARYLFSLWTVRIRPEFLSVFAGQVAQDAQRCPQDDYDAHIAQAGDAGQRDDEATAATQNIQSGAAR